MRQRRIELRRTLAVAAPVYILLTKADLLAGFVEYYDDLDVEGRRAVLGATLPWTGASPAPDALARAYDAMAQGIADRQAKRLFEEVDAARRSAVLGFPAQVDLLRPRLMRFLDGVFTPGEEQGGVLRGFYLTSGVQQGTPLDRIMSGVADVYDRPGEANPSARLGRAYFLNRLLGEVMFPKPGWRRSIPPLKRRQRLQLAGVLGGIGAASALILLGWSVSFAKNRAFEADLEFGCAAVAAREAQASRVDMQEVSASDPDLRAALPLLNTLRDLPRGYAVRQNGAPPLLMTLGLYQQGLSLKADGAYRDALRRILLPRLLLRLEEIMRGSGGDPNALYEPLKTYLMLGGQGPLDRG
ncbi:type VI secretion protein IcmF/TssM N-terminal domain-containing protein [Sphingomonas sp. MMS24-JH45]